MPRYEEEDWRDEFADEIDDAMNRGRVTPERAPQSNEPEPKADEASREEVFYVLHKELIGQTVRAKIVNATKYGLFAEFGNNLEGLIHCSELGWGTSNRTLQADDYRVGQEVTAKVLSLNDKGSFSLSIRIAETDPLESFSMTHKAGDRIKGTITINTPNGAFIQLPGGVEGGLHVSDYGDTPLPQKGEEVEVQIISIDLQSRKIQLTRRGL